MDDKKKLCSLCLLLRLNEILTSAHSRAHLNDLENIPIFFVASFFYQFTNPAPFIAINLIRAFALTRILHTIIYAVFPLPQPSRALSWGVGYGITGYMAVKTILYFL
uniref:Microsomal glutathione S-transferase 1 n=1 Tax=Timema tahoe TaxID=61484 RepID=A0A7R9ISS4_9NEOP|nr:unnamed protein product [Timema tahoe]